MNRLASPHLLNWILSSEKLPILTCQWRYFSLHFFVWALECKKLSIPFLSKGWASTAWTDCAVLQASGFPRGKSTWGGQTILQRKKGVERSLAPNLLTDRNMHKPFHMEKGITKSLSLFAQEGLVEGLKFQDKPVNKSRGLCYVTSGLKNGADMVREACGQIRKSVRCTVKMA